MEAEAASRRGDPLNSASCKYAAELRDHVAIAPEYMTETDRRPIDKAASHYKRERFHDVYDRAATPS